MNVAVGGTNGFFPDTWTNAAYPKPWSNTSPTAPRQAYKHHRHVPYMWDMLMFNVSRDFWNARGSWYPTWNPDVNNGEDAAMVVDYVRVYEN